MSINLVLAIAAVVAILLIAWLALRRRRPHPHIYSMTARMIGEEILDRDRRWLYDNLTPREMDVARLVAQGLHNLEIADELVLSINTVDTHLTHIYRKLGVHSRIELARQIRDLVDD